jgi:hypothetical protein
MGMKIYNVNIGILNDWQFDGLWPFDRLRQFERSNNRTFKLSNGQTFLPQANAQTKKRTAHLW